MAFCEDRSQSKCKRTTMILVSSVNFYIVHTKSSKIMSTLPSKRMPIVQCRRCTNVVQMFDVFWVFQLVVQHVFESLLNSPCLKLCGIYEHGVVIRPGAYEVYFARMVSYLGEREVLCVGNDCQFCIHQSF